MLSTCTMQKNILILTRFNFPKNALKKTCRCGGKEAHCAACHGKGEYWADEGAAHDPWSREVIVGARGFATQQAGKNFTKRQ